MIIRWISNAPRGIGLVRCILTGPGDFLCLDGTVQNCPNASLDLLNNMILGASRHKLGHAWGKVDDHFESILGDPEQGSLGAKRTIVVLWLDEHNDEFHCNPRRDP